MLLVWLHDSVAGASGRRRYVARILADAFVKVICKSARAESGPTDPKRRSCRKYPGKPKTRLGRANKQTNKQASKAPKWGARSFVIQSRPSGGFQRRKRPFLQPRALPRLRMFWRGRHRIRGMPTPCNPAGMHHTSGRPSGTRGTRRSPAAQLRLRAHACSPSAPTPAVRPQQGLRDSPCAPPSSQLRPPSATPMGRRRRSAVDPPRPPSPNWARAREQRCSRESAQHVRARRRGRRALAPL